MARVTARARPGLPRTSVLSTNWPTVPVSGSVRTAGSVMRAANAAVKRSACRNLEWSAVVDARGGVDQVGETEPVVGGGDGLVGAGQVVLARVPVGGGEGPRRGES